MTGGVSPTGETEMLATTTTFVSISRAEHQALATKAELGKVLGRNIERAAAVWAALVSLILAATQPTVSYYDPIVRFMPLSVWAWMVGAMSVSRVVVLIVNGYWPVTFQVRIGYSIATLMLVWMVLAGLSWLAFHQRGVIYPGAALAPLAVSIELLCFLALRARLESVRQGVATDVGYSGGGDRDRGERSAAGVR